MNPRLSLKRSLSHGMAVTAMLSSSTQIESKYFKVGSKTTSKSVWYLQYLTDGQVPQRNSMVCLNRSSTVI